LTSDLG
jgi:hypothetical protein